MSSRSTPQRAADAVLIDLPWGVYEERLIVNGEKRVYSVDNDKRLFEWRTVALEEVEATTADLFAKLSQAHPKQTASAAQTLRHLQLVKF